MVNISKTSDLLQTFRSPTYEAVFEDENQHDPRKDINAEEWSTSLPVRRKNVWSRETLYSILLAVAFAIYSSQVWLNIGLEEYQT